MPDGTVLIPRQDTNDYLVKYPNNTRGRMVKAWRQCDNLSVRTTRTDNGGEDHVGRLQAAVMYESLDTWGEARLTAPA